MMDYTFSCNLNYNVYEVQFKKQNGWGNNAFVTSMLLTIPKPKDSQQNNQWKLVECNSNLRNTLNMLIHTHFHNFYLFYG